MSIETFNASFESRQNKYRSDTATQGLSDLNAARAQLRARGFMNAVDPKGQGI